MHWKLKARIQKLVSLLPSSASYATYYWLQRHLGGLRKIDPIDRLSAGVEIWKRIGRHGQDPAGRVFLEIGTGRVPLVPMAYWLMGAKRTITYDLNPYVKEELIRESLQHISYKAEKIRALFGSLLDGKRYDLLLALGESRTMSTRGLLDLCSIDYVAPGDAGKTGLPSNSVDFHTSYATLEHIPPEVLKRIFEEGNRIVNRRGLFVHRIDYSDHFSHSDPTVPAINFLQFSDEEWNAYAGNRYMYMNRLRHDDFMRILQSAGHRVLETELDADVRSRELVRKGILKLNERFKAKPEEILAIIGSWIVSEKTC